MYTLGVETSSHQGSLTIFKERDILDSAQWSRVGSHSEFLTASLQSLLKKHNLTPQNLNRLAVGVGPGSFTGIRVGVNFVRALSYALRLPVFCLNSLHLLASQVRPPSILPIRVAQYAFRDLLYTALYRQDEGLVIQMEPPSALSVDDIFLLLKAPTLVIGSGSELMLNSKSTDHSQFIIRNPDLSDDPLSIFFQNTSALDQSPVTLTDWIHTIPLYIRASEAEEKLKAGI